MMTSRTQPLKQTAFRMLYTVAVFVLIMVTLAPYALAESASSPAPSAGASCIPVSSAPSGVSKPTGDDAATYLYNKCTGLWENQYYTWSPKTQVATPKTPLVYTCDTSKWKWLAHEWVYDPAADKFTQVAVYKASLPGGAVIAADSTAPCTPPAPKVTAPTTASDPPQQRPANDPKVTNSDNTSTTVGNNTAAVMQNKVSSDATSGDAKVVGNVQGGNAASGNATEIANILNSVQSSSALADGKVATFVANVDGDVLGDLIIDPSMLQPAADSSVLTNAHLTVNDKNAGTIHNDINLSAASGNAAVKDNTKAGNATSGSATAIANVVNMLNSIVAAGKSFVGIVNINGNMHGDILMPQGFLDSLIASNAPSTTVTLDQNQANNLGITTTNSLATTNNITSSATSGAATVAGNTTAGSAKTGNTTTNVRIFNLTGSQIVGANSLLVFVNVSGTWVGVIMNAPAGATAAALGSGLAENDTNASIANATNNAITNDIAVNAKSGDATVRGNTEAGNATSGDARTVVNLLNINDSQFSLAGWFGILFINIFGNWYGNFGVFTPQVPSQQSSHSTSGPSAAQPPAQPQMFRFESTAPASSSAGGADTSTPIESLAAQLTSETGGVLGAGVETVNKNVSHSAPPNRSSQIFGGVMVATGLVALAAERVISARSARRIRPMARYP